MVIQHCFWRCGRSYARHTYVAIFSWQPGAGNLKMSTQMQHHNLSLGWKLRMSAHKVGSQADTLWYNWRVKILSGNGFRMNNENGESQGKTEARQTVVPPKIYSRVEYHFWFFLSSSDARELRKNIETERTRSDTINSKEILLNCIIGLETC